LDRVSTTSR